MQITPGGDTSWTTEYADAKITSLTATTADRIVIGATELGPGWIAMNDGEQELWRTETAHSPHALAADHDEGIFAATSVGYPGSPVVTAYDDTGTENWTADIDPELEGEIRAMRGTSDGGFVSAGYQRVEVDCD
jgi:hypothetical protein